MIRSCTLWLPLAFSLLTATAHAAEDQAVRELMVRFKAARQDPQKRVAAVKEIVATGPTAVAALKEMLDKDLARLEAALPAANLKAQNSNIPAANTATLDQQIAALRKILADLRALPDLKKEQLETIGKPAIEQLTAAFQERNAILAAHYQKHVGPAAQLQQLSAFFVELSLEETKPGSLGLPLADYNKRADAALARVTPQIDPILQSLDAANALVAPKLEPEVVAGMNAVNHIRIVCGLNPLVFDPKLCLTATDHSTDMQKLDFFAHESPVEGKKTPWDRAKRFDTTASGENIFAGSDASVEAIKAWFVSPGHHKNLLGDHKRQGLGHAGKYWTQMFGG